MVQLTNATTFDAKEQHQLQLEEFGSGSYVDCLLHWVVGGSRGVD